MAEPRTRVYHRNRVAESLREEIGAMLEGELSDPRIAFCHVTEVVMNPAAKSARVFLAVDGGEVAETNTVAALLAAKGYIRHEIQERLGLRRIPDLTFHIDRAEKLQSRIDELLGRSKKRARAAQLDSAASESKPENLPIDSPLS